MQSTPLGVVVADKLVVDVVDDDRRVGLSWDGDGVRNALVEPIRAMQVSELIWNFIVEQSIVVMGCFGECCSLYS